MMDYYIICSTEDGIRISGPMTAEVLIASIERETRENERAPVILTKMPEQDKGCFFGVPDGAIVILRGEVVTLNDVTRCPCQSGKSFAECHGADADPAPAPNKWGAEDLGKWVDGDALARFHAPGCLHEKVFNGERFQTAIPRWHWICAKCGAIGTDSLPVETPPPVDRVRYEHILQRKQ